MPTDTVTIILIALVAAGLGAAVGWAYLALLRRSLPALLQGRAGWGRFGALLLVRMALFAAGLLAAVQAGWAGLVGYTLGFLIVRTVLVHVARAEAAQPED